MSDGAWIEFGIVWLAIAWFAILLACHDYDGPEEPWLDADPDEDPFEEKAGPRA